MFQYYFTRFNIILFFTLLLFWGVNFSKDIPWTREYHGDVVKCEIVSAEKANRNFTIEYTDITYIMPSGKVETKHSYPMYKSELGKYQYEKVYNEGKFYTNRTWLIIVASILTFISGMTFLFTLVSDSMQHIESFFELDDKINRQKMRLMRIDHTVFVDSFFGIDSSIDKDLYKKAIELYKAKDSKDFRGIVRIPTYSDVIEGITHEYEILLKQKS